MVATTISVHEIPGSQLAVVQGNSQTIAPRGAIGLSLNMAQKVAAGVVAVTMVFTMLNTPLSVRYS